MHPQVRSRTARFPLALGLFLAGACSVATADVHVPSTCDGIPAHVLARGVEHAWARRLLLAGQQEDAIRAFSCVTEREPTSIHGYRGRAEANLLLGRFADAFSDYARITAYVFPADPDAFQGMLYAYESRLLRNPHDVAALMAESFARWTAFDYEGAQPLFDRFAEIDPDNVYGKVFGASNRLFLGLDVDQALADLDAAIALAPHSADVRYIVADAYTYAHPDPDRAFEEASLALQWGLDTPRVHAILASSHLAWLDLPRAAHHLQRHIELVTTNPIVADEPLVAASSQTIELAPGITFELAVPVTAGEMLSIRTHGPQLEIYDSIAVLLAPDGTPVTGNDDFDDFLAGFDWVAPATGTYTLRVTSFEGVGTGELTIERL
jgi:tetratricopeptide (TPR) repeat protein